MIDYTNPKPQTYDVDKLRETEIMLRDELFLWATRAPSANPTTGSINQITLLDPIGDRMTYIEMGDQITARLNAIKALQTHAEVDAERHAYDRKHLSGHFTPDEDGKEPDPISDWELELLGLRKIQGIRYEVVCYTCADKSGDSRDYFGKKLEWHLLDSNELVTQMKLDFAIQARDSHLDMFPDHRVELDLV